MSEPRTPYIVSLIRDGQGYWMTTAYDCVQEVLPNGHLLLIFTDAETGQPGKLFVCHDDTLIVCPGTGLATDEVGH